MLTSNVQLVTYWQGIGGVGGRAGRGTGGERLSRAGYLAPNPAKNSERMGTTKILSHHLLQKYLVERDINLISANLRCLLQTFSWVTY